MKYILVFVVGFALTLFVAYTYESQLLACITGGILGGITGGILAYLYNSDHELDNRRRM